MTKRKMSMEGHIWKSILERKRQMRKTTAEYLEIALDSINDADYELCQKLNLATIESGRLEVPQGPALLSLSNARRAIQMAYVANRQNEEKANDNPDE